MIMKSLMIIFLATCMTIPAYSEGYPCCKAKGNQGKHTANVKRNYYLTLGGSIVENQDVTKRTERLGYPGFSRYNLSLGFGSFRSHNRFVEGGEFEGLLWKRNTSGNLESRFGAGRTVSFIGYSLFKNPHITLFPLIGLGAGISFLRAGPTEVPFDSSFTVPSQTPPDGFIYQGSFLIDAGIGAFISRSHPKKKYKNIAFGIRAGYLFDPVDSENWYRNGITLKDGPDSNLSGPYLRMTFGVSKNRCEKRGCKNSSCKHWNRNRGKGKCTGEETSAPE